MTIEQELAQLHATRARLELAMMIQAFINTRFQAGAQQTTLDRLTSQLGCFGDWLVDESGREDQRAMHTACRRHGDDQVLFAYNAALVMPKSAGGRGLAKSSSVAYTHTARRFWEWAARRWRDIVPPAPMFEMQVEPTAPVLAPTWAQMDASIHAATAMVREVDQANEWLRRMFWICRFTGLRSGQVGRLEWADFDFEAATLHIRPELGKTAAERTGRLIPVSQHLLAEMAGWGRREGQIVGVARSNRRQARAAHKAAGLPTNLYKQRPFHMFRRGFETRIIADGGGIWETERYIGHAVALGESAAMSRYLDQSAIVERLRSIADAVPPVGPLFGALSLPKRPRQRPGQTDGCAEFLEALHRHVAEQGMTWTEVADVVGLHRVTVVNAHRRTTWSPALRQLEVWLAEETGGRQTGYPAQGEG